MCLDLARSSQARLHTPRQTRPDAKVDMQTWTFLPLLGDLCPWTGVEGLFFSPAGCLCFGRRGMVRHRGAWKRRRFGTHAEVGRDPRVDVPRKENSHVAGICYAGPLLRRETVLFVGQFFPEWWVNLTLFRPVLESRWIRLFFIFVVPNSLSYMPGYADS